MSDRPPPNLHGWWKCHQLLLEEESCPCCPKKGCALPLRISSSHFRKLKWLNSKPSSVPAHPAPLCLLNRMNRSANTELIQITSCKILRRSNPSSSLVRHKAGNHEILMWRMSSWWEGLFPERYTCINQLNGNDSTLVILHWGHWHHLGFLWSRISFSPSFSKFSFWFEFFISPLWQQEIAIFLRYKGETKHFPCQKRVLQSGKKCLLL